MPKCEIVWHIMHIGHHVAGTQRAVAQCMTHQWPDVPGVSQNLPEGQTMCPIGRIEDATEKALAQIEAARKS